jgi:hypothetical protein
MKHKHMFVLFSLLVGFYTICFATANSVKYSGLSGSPIVVQDYVSIGDLSGSITTTYTVEAWFKASELNGASNSNSNYGYTIVSSSPDVNKYPFWLTAKGSELIVWSFTETSTPLSSRTTTGANLTAGTWYHVAVTAVKGGTTKVYVNGVQKLSYTNEDKGTWSTGFTVGALRPAPSLNPTFFLGLIDEVRVWNTVRTQAEIAADMDNEIAAPLPAALKGYWRFNETAGTNAPDLASSGHNGTLKINASWNSPTSGAPLTADIPLPVELSSFTATLTAENYVTVKWITQSETGVGGYYIYRSIDEDWANSVKISDMIEAANSTVQQVYQYTDNELAEDGTYYYWLQVQDLDGTTISHGPTSVYYSSTGEAPQVPGIVPVSGIKFIYPNPITPYSVISYTLTKAADVKFKIFNSRGQMVNSFVEGFKNDGSYNSRWDGKDSSGNNCPTGIYYIKMQAGKDSSMRKVVIIK